MRSRERCVRGFAVRCGDGRSEPPLRRVQVRDNFRSALISQPEVLEGARLHTMVTVVDGSTFLDEFQKRNKLQDRPDLGTGEYVDITRQVVDLMCEQIECADILILNTQNRISLAYLQGQVAHLHGRNGER